MELKKDEKRGAACGSDCRRFVRKVVLQLLLNAGLALKRALLDVSQRFCKSVDPKHPALDEAPTEDELIREDEVQRKMAPSRELCRWFARDGNAVEKTAEEKGGQHPTCDRSVEVRGWVALS